MRPVAVVTGASSGIGAATAAQLAGAGYHVVLAADRNLTAVAKQLKAGGVPGTMDTLRAEAFLALLTGTSVGSLLPGDPSAPRESADTGGAAPAGPFDPATAANPARLTATANPTPGLGGAVNLTMPLATWLGFARPADPYADDLSSAPPGHNRERPGCPGRR